MTDCSEALRIILPEPTDYFRDGFATGMYRLDESFRSIAKAQSEGILTESDLEKIRGQRQRPIQEFLLTASESAQSARLAAYRKDWLLVDAIAGFILDLLTWAKALEDEQFTDAVKNRESWLRELATRTGVESSVDHILFARDMRKRADGLVSLTIAVVESASSYLDHRIDKRLKRLRELEQEPAKVSASRHPTGASEFDRVLNRAMTCIDHVPGLHGVLLTGSAAGDFRDAFSDVDIVCVCKERPNDEIRDDLLRCLGVSESFRFGATEYLRLDNLALDLQFIRARDQRRSFENLKDDGVEQPMLTFGDEQSHEVWALPSYRWVTGRILKDDSSLLSSFQEQASNYPDALQKRIWQKWSPLWETYSQRFLEGLQKNDNVSAFTSLSWCEEAAFRLLFASRRVHCNPIEPKNFPNELLLIQSIPRRLIPPLSMIKLGESSYYLQNQFENISALWSYGLEKCKDLRE